MDAPREVTYSLFPPIEDPRRSGMLPVDDLHSLYWEECGNPDGMPVVYLHGGPWEGAPPSKRQFWDPDHYRIVLFDQRGSLRSTPLAELRNNTTQALVEDIEKLREHLGIERWLITGGSWGTTGSATPPVAHCCATTRKASRTSCGRPDQHRHGLPGCLDAWYFKNNLFLEEDQLIQNIDAVRHLPCKIIQGGHDMIATPNSAYRLHKAWPGSVLNVINDAGHAPSEPGIISALIEATEQFKHTGRFS